MIIDCISPYSDLAQRLKHVLFMLNSTEQETILLMNVKIPAIVGI